MQRRKFIDLLAVISPTLLIPIQIDAPVKRQIMSVKGPIHAKDLGRVLPHEHILVDFIGADKTGYDRWDKKQVIKRASPYLEMLKNSNFATLVECTPAYLGRDPKLLLALADQTGLNLITNTGYYGARNFIFLPDHAKIETAEQLAQRWINEFENGIEDTGIRPGFIKIGVNGKSLLPLEQKLIRAAALTHKSTGLTIASHTGPAIAALQQIEILVQMSIHPGAFIWVHAQNESDLSKHIEAAKLGAWISLDGFSEKKVAVYVEMLLNLKHHGLLNKALVSHDAGWYTPGEKNGGNYVGYTDIAVHLMPTLLKQGFSQDEIDLLSIENPAKALTIGVKEL